ncbi:MAG: hypothetical protein ACRDPC_04540 [Solirubrobacteraceae bacterium]
MTDDGRREEIAQLEAIRRSAPASRRPPRLSGSLLIKALGASGPMRPSASLVERARFELRLLYEGDALDVGEYVRRLIELEDDIEDCEP